MVSYHWYGCKHNPDLDSGFGGSKRTNPGRTLYYYSIKMVGRNYIDSLRDVFGDEIDELMPEEELRVVNVEPNIHVGATYQQERVVRLDSMTYPEFYAEVNLDALTERGVKMPGRFWGAHVNAHPVCRWTKIDKEFAVDSPDGDISMTVVLE